jgi:subtilisin family serine protease/Leucine-rich repeat (LRR) protein
MFSLALIAIAAESEKQVYNSNDIYAQRSKSATRIRGFKERLNNRIVSRKINRTGGVAAGQGLMLKDRIESVPGQLIVKYKKGRATARMKRDLELRHNMRQIKHIPFADIHVYRLAKEKSRDDVLGRLKKNTAIQYAEPDYILKANTVPNDTSFNKLWGLHNTGQTGGTADADIDAPEAWNVATGNMDVVVAVIDTGVDYTHPDLAANMWTNTGETPGDGIDNDGNGYIDDVYGINAITGTGNPMDDNNHGSHCAGTIGGVGNNGTGVAGVNWRVKIMALKFLSSGGSGSTSDALTCVQYAVSKGAHVMSNSWGGGGYSQAMYDAIETAKNNGILFIAAAGNSSVNNDLYPHYPSSYTNDNIIAVAATDHNDQMAYFSCYGAASVDVAAPGVSIYSTVPGNAYASFSGTSMATPHVAGLAALLKSHNPSLSWQQIKSQILDTAEPLAALEGKVLTGARINAFYALTNSVPPTIAITSPANNGFESGDVSVLVDASGSAGIAKVEFYIDDVLTATKTVAPYQYTWDSTSTADGNHHIRVVAYDPSDLTAEDSVTVNINNSGLPSVMILAPADQETLLGDQTIQVSADYAPGLSMVEFYIDGTLLNQDATAPYLYTWNSLSVPNGQHDITVKAIGTDNAEAAATITVNVDNIVIPESERNALIALYNSTNGDNWWFRDNWKKADGSFNDYGTEHTWEGVWVENNHVIYLDLFCNNLTGTLPAELANLTELLELPLFWNYLTGPIPPEIGSLSKLEYFDLEDNDITGEIPSELGNLTQLQELWLDENAFTGGIPTSFGNLSNLMYLYMWDSQLTGPIPVELTNCNQLLEIELYWNNLTGSIPAQLGTMTQLQYLDLDGNQLTGPIPAELGNLVNLRVLWLNSMNLEGGIPAQFGNLAALEYLYLYDSHLTGEIPAVLGTLPQLISLELDGNRLTGTIPAELGNLSNLTYLYLGDNQLTGTIPAELGNLSSLKLLSIQDNHLNGELPIELKNLVSLKYFYIQGNAITGPIYQDFSNVTGLLGGYANIDYNGLFAADQTTRTFLNTTYPDWNATQTAAPSVVSAHALTSSAVAVSWTPIPYTADTGRYNIYYGTTPGGPYSLYGSTADKTAATMTIDGLTPSTTYYFVVQTVTEPHTYNTNTVTSKYSTEAIAATPEPPSLTLTSPNGGETWESGSTQSVTWSSTGLINTVTLSYSTAGTDGTFVTIASAIPNTGSYTWTVPGADTLHARIRVKHDGGTSEDLSDADFTIIPRPTVTVSAPNGGEEFKQGTSEVITWNYENMTGSVTVEVWAGATLQATIGTAAVEDRTFTWNIPSDFPAGENYRIKILQGTIVDNSDAYFTVTASRTKKARVDFNGDGKPDILWRFYDPSKPGLNMVWTMNGTQKMGANQWVRRVGKLSWKIVGAADFTGDGKTDILWRYDGPESPGLTMLWAMDGIQKVGKNMWLPRLSNLNWKIEAVADFNGDGKADILWRYYGANAPGINMIWLMDGKKRISKNIWLPRIKNLNWKIQAADDFNGDGKPDILWRHYGTGVNMVWTLDGTKKVGPLIWLPRISNVNWKIADTGDYNGDGKTDILWRYTGTGGFNMIWTMDGTKKIGSNIWIRRLNNLNWKIEQ